MSAENEDDFGGRLPAWLARKTGETPEEAALREEKQRGLYHAREGIAAFAFVTIVLGSGAVSLYVVARWAGAVAVLDTLSEAPRSLSAWDSLPARVAAVAVISLGGLCVLWGRFVEPALVRTTHLEIETKKLPPARPKPLRRGEGPQEGAPPPRLVFLADLHVEGRSPRPRRVAQIAAGLAPEAILLGGDYLNNDRDRSVEALARAVKALVEVAPVYAVIGNADEPRPVAYRTVAAAGARVLVNEPVELTGGVTVWGLRWLDDEALEEAASRLDRTRFNICLTHAPGMIPGAARAGFDLCLTGHTHGGQVRLPLYGALVTLSVHGKRFECGRYELPEGMTAYVTRGIGLEGGYATRVRFMCPPEVVLVDFVPSSPGS